MAAAEIIYSQSVMERVVRLPLVSSTYGLVSSVYSSTKHTHPYLRTVCEAAEQGVRTITSVALSTASPLLDKLEPQIAIANGLACKGLDRMEKTLPILHQPSQQIVSSARDAVTSAKEVVTGGVCGAKESVSDTLSGVVERTRGAVHDGVERTRTVVRGGVGTVLESRAARLVTGGVDRALSTSESLVERYLPLLEEEELEIEAKTVEGFDKNDPSYYVRLGSLSHKLRQRAYTRVQRGRQRSVEFISALNSTVDVIEYSRKKLDGANQVVKDKHDPVAVWKSNGQTEQSHEAEVIESRTLSMARSLTQRLQTTCLVLASGLQGLPGHVQQEALSLGRSASRVYSSLSRARVPGDLSDGVSSSSRARLSRMKESLDTVRDYVVNNTPLNWLVGPFYPRVAPESDDASNSARGDVDAHPESPCCLSLQNGPMQVEMESLHTKRH